MALLRFSAIHNGVQTAEISLTEIYDRATFTRFESRWEAFFASDPAHPAIYQKDGATIHYQTGYFVPNVRDVRPPVLLLFGNPASHSTKIGMCFSYEGNQRKHRFWSVLKESGFLEFDDGSEMAMLDTVSRNAKMKADFLNLRYTSPFRIGIAPILSMPSTASAPPWSGVGGLYKLFGKRALLMLLAEERKRIAEIVGSFLGEQGVIAAFQKDAYETVRLPESPPYTLDHARANQLTSAYRGNPTIPLFGGVPTRFWTGHAIRQGLHKLRHKIEHYFE
jgi:hypothetical protein